MYVAGDGLSLVSFGGRRIWLSTRATLTDLWGPSTDLGAELKLPGTQIRPSLSPDGLTLLFIVEGTTNDTGELWFSKRSAPTAKFGPAAPVGPPVNAETPVEAALLLADNETFVFRRDETWYVTVKNASGVKTAAALPAHPFTRSSLWLSPDCRTAYFTFGGRGTLGGSDVLVTRRVPKGQAQPGSSPANVKPPAK
jgi:hypothetical protein